MFFGVATGDGCVYCDQPLCPCLGPTPTPKFDDQGRQIFTLVGIQPTPGGAYFAGAETVVEGRHGTSGQPVGSTLLPQNATDRPDVWIESDQPLGLNPTALVECRNPGALPGGVPAINPPSFGPDQTITDAITDYACRFVRFSPSAPCTFIDATGEAKLVNANSEVQFCTDASLSIAFPLGDSHLSVELRDSVGNLGPTAQVVVRVVTPTPAH